MTPCSCGRLLFASDQRSQTGEQLEVSNEADPKGVPRNICVSGKIKLQSTVIGVHVVFYMIEYWLASSAGVTSAVPVGTR